MKKDCLIIILLLTISTIFNFYSDWSFLLNTEIVSLLWLLFYILIIPMVLVRYAYKNTNDIKGFVKKSLVFIAFYCTSIILSSINFFDFENFELVGDGASMYVIKFVFTVCFLSTLSVFIYYLIKRKKHQIK
jgi:hypothetical protein